MYNYQKVEVKLRIIGLIACVKHRTERSAYMI